MPTQPDPNSLALVTGTPGWLGTRLAETLVRGLADHPDLAAPRFARIRCLALPDADTTALEALPNVSIVRGDVTRADTLREFVDGTKGASLFHCAGIIHPNRAAEFHAVNAMGTRHVIDAATAAGVRRIVHMSSNSPFGANPSRDHLFNEDAPYHPYMGYGRSKMAAEQAVFAAHNAGTIEAVVVRAPWFYGPGQPARQTTFFTMIKTGKFPLLGDGGNKRSMSYVDNLCQGLMLAEQRGRSGEAYWIADARPYSMNEIVDTVETVLRRDFNIPVSGRRTRVPSVIGDVARVADGVMQQLGRYDQRVHVLSEMNLTIACSVAKAERELGYRPAVALEEGMRRSIAWVLSKGISI